MVPDRPSRTTRATGRDHPSLKRRASMTRRKKKPKGRLAPLRWEFDPDIPTHDFFEGGSLDDISNLQEAVEDFVFRLEEGDFLTWEAVVSEEQGLPLTAPQKKILGSLVNFSD